MKPGQQLLLNNLYLLAFMAKFELLLESDFNQRAMLLDYLYDIALSLPQTKAGSCLIDCLDLLTIETLKSKDPPCFKNKILIFWNQIRNLYQVTDKKDYAHVIALPIKSKKLQHFSETILKEK